MPTLAILNNLRFQDIIDVLFLTLMAYHLFLWFRGTKAFKALIGLMAIGIIFTAASTWGLFLTTWVFQIFWQVLVLLLIILFQSEIRQVLERVNPLKTIGLRKLSGPEEWIQAFVEAVFELSRQRIGALVIVERVDRVEEFITEGQSLEGKPNKELLKSIFQKESPLHDGAVLIRDGRIAQVACYLPLSPDEGLPKKWGTRHRAALGLSERCDASVIVVSEERGEVSLARGKKMIQLKDGQHLSEQLREATSQNQQQKRSWKQWGHLLFIRRWQAKAGTFILVSVAWLLLAGQQDFEKAFKVPLEATNVPVDMKISEPIDPKVHITVRGLRRDASTLDEKSVSAKVDISTAEYGQRLFTINRDNIRLPNDRLYIVNIDPPSIEFKLNRKF